MKNKLKIAVIGAGAWGGWTAFFLHCMGADVTLIDAWGAGNSRAGSGGESRVIRASYGTDEIYSQLVFRSYEILGQFSEAWNIPLVHKTGAIWLFQNNPKYGKQTAEVMQNYDYHFEQLDLAKAIKKFPQINFEDIHQVYYEADAGFIEARKVCRDVCEQYQKAGGDFRLAFAKLHGAKNNKLTSVKCSDGQIIEADQFVFACGPWNKTFFPDFFQHHASVSRQEVYYFGLPENAKTFLAPQLPIWLDFDEEEILHYGIPDHKYRGFKVAYDIREKEIDPTNDDRAPTPEILARSRQFLTHRFPKMKNAPLLETRVCNYENSTDGHFIIDRHPVMQNVLIAGGSSGHGYKMGSAIGEMIANNILEGKEIDPFFKFQRLEKIKENSSQFFS